MADTLKLMAVLAHPDDESLGTGGILAKYAAEGVETFLVTATRGERGWVGDEHQHPDLEVLGQIREAELQAATEILGISSVDFLGYIDGELDQADPAEVVNAAVQVFEVVAVRRAVEKESFLPIELRLSPVGRGEHGRAAVGEAHDNAFGVFGEAEVE